ncbi:response regulator transcription factor [Polaromonas sp. A23]|uniref:response regulator n=1 Tax=Polaromonas sp. A23 TaxID=1944133 RepID=UPI000985B7CB|nr:response regulator transcription factor [Polaromonas sp. A23]OOG41076.1 DNA-binding response regulator [Polaromonas sp. A23]
MRIFVIDDHPLMREAVVLLIRRLHTKATVTELDRLAAIGPAVEQHGIPDFICLDLKLPDTHGVSGVRELRQQFPEVPIVVLSAAPAQDYQELSLEAGADVYIEKSVGATEISKVLRSFVVDDSADPEASTEPEKLSKRQKQLLVMLDKGMSNRDIATELQISEHTVKVHLWRLFRRLNVKSRSQASHLARTQGLL